MGMNTPDHPTINHIRSKQLKENIKTLFSLKEHNTDGAIERI